MHDDFEDIPGIDEICASFDELCKMEEDDAFWENFLPERIEEEIDWAVPVNTEEGATCIKCLEFYPYACPKNLKTFKCWGCRNF